MQDNFELIFPGFGGSESRCHVRILSDANRPVVVIVSQVRTKPGTSIMNAYEIIRGYVYEYLAKKREEKQSFDRAEQIDGMAEAIEKTGKLRTAIIVYLLRRWAKTQRHSQAVTGKSSSDEPEVYWIEHWPDGTGLQREVQYLLVSENEAGNPSWGNIKISDISTWLGYSEEDFIIPNDAVA